MDGIRSNQESKDYQPQPEVKRQFEEEPSEVAVKKSQLKMNVQTPKVMLGIKARHVNLQGKELLKTELSANILLEMLFGKSSSIHESLYSAGLIDQSFSYDYTQEQGFGFALLGGDTLHPDELSEKLTDLLLQAKTGTGLDEKSLERIIKKKIGSFLRSLNSPEYIANQFTRYAFNDMNLFDVVPILEQINFDDIKQTAETLIDESQITVCQVIPK